MQYLSLTKKVAPGMCEEFFQSSLGKHTAQQRGVDDRNGGLTGEWPANVKRCHTSLVTREMRIEHKAREYSSFPLGWHKFEFNNMKLPRGRGVMNKYVKGCLLVGARLSHPLCGAFDASQVEETACDLILLLPGTCPKEPLNTSPQRYTWRFSSPRYLKWQK